MSYLAIAGVNKLVVQDDNTVLMIGEVAQRGEGLQVDAAGIYNPPTQDDRSQYDEQSPPFGFLDSNTSLIYFLQPDGSWSTGIPFPSGGGSGSDANFTFTQAIPAAQWNIVHALGKKPSVTLLDDFGKEFEAEVTHNSTSSITIDLTIAGSGTAELN